MARAWFRTGETAVPSELTALLGTHPWTRGFVLEQAIAEMPLRLDNYGGRDRRCDVLLIGRTDEGGIVIAVEAKADEPFGPLITAHREYGLMKSQSRVSLRIDDLMLAVLGVNYQQADATVRGLRYQLLHTVAGVLAESQRLGFARAALIVHEFRSAISDPRGLAANAADLQRFVRHLPGQAHTEMGVGEFLGPISVPGGGMVPANVGLLIAKVVSQLGTMAKPEVVTPITVDPS